MLGLGLGLNKGGYTDAYQGIVRDAKGLWGLNQLKAGADKAITVRRSSDDTEQDIGFVGNKFDSASLLSFVGAGSGYVTKIYDQSGNGNHATQSTASYQPRIVNAGVIETDSNGDYSIYYDGTDDWMTIADTAGLDIISGGLSLVAKHDNDNPDGSAQYMLTRNNDSVSSGNFQYGLSVLSANGTYLRLNASNLAGDNNIDEVAKVNIATWDDVNTKMYLNGTLIESQGRTLSLTSNPNIQIGCRSNSVDGAIGTLFYGGHISDIMVYDKALTQPQITTITNKL